MTNLNLDLRKEVLFYSLLVETSVSNFLAHLLGIKDAAQTLCFGNKSTALSFNQKINLLIDIAALEKTQQIKFVTFMEVRNQFMHNASADSYENCFSFLGGKDKFILKHYPQDAKLSREDQLKGAFEALANDVTKSAIGLFNKVKEKITADATNKSHKATVAAFTKATKLWDEQVTEYLKSIPEGDKSSIPISEIKKFGLQVRRRLFQLIVTELKKDEEDDSESKGKN